MMWTKNLALLLALAASAAGQKLTSISPTSGAQGASIPVTLTGTNFASPCTVGVANIGITVVGCNVVNSTTITSTFNIAGNAPQGTFNVAVTTPGGSYGGVAFTV